MTGQQVVFIGSHLGYPMEKTPLGGGAMVGLQLARHWSKAGREGLWVLGSGPESPARGLRYVRLPEHGAGAKPLVSLSELEYARFCRRFESATTDWVFSQGFDPKRTCVIVNDISEGPTLTRLAAGGFPIVSLWHVDVVDYFNRLYLKEAVRIESLIKSYDRLFALGAAGALPDLLKLVFEKQRQTVAHSQRLIFPSNAMAKTIERCYRPEGFAERGVVVPWGIWEHDASVAEDAPQVAALRAHYQIGAQTTVLMTLSRISPEKGIHLLLEALRLLEQGGGLPQDACLFICGEAAFMQGAAYLKEVRAATHRLKKVRVFFPGYLDDARKQAYYRLAHLFISPSIHDSYGLNIVEAMQAGLPILASDHYGVQDLLREGFGVKVRYPSLSGAPKLLAGALKRLLADPARLEAMGRSARVAAHDMPFEQAAQKVWSNAVGLLARDGAEVRA
jgi:glycosyltransferase involved in cell wall biosynthesis